GAGRRTEMLASPLDSPLDSPPSLRAPTERLARHRGVRPRGRWRSAAFAALLHLPAAPAFAGPGKRLYYGAIDAAAVSPASSTLYKEAIAALVFLGLILFAYAVWNYRLLGANRRKSQELALAQANLEHRGRALESLLEVGFALSCQQNADDLLSQVVGKVRDGLGF